MKRKLLLPIALVLVAAIGLAVWAMWPKHRSNTIVLADGSKLEYLGATVGANCSFNYGSLWQRLVARLPRSLAQKIGVGTIQRAVVNAGYSGDSSVVFWFVRRGKVGALARAKTTSVVYKSPLHSPTYAIGAGEVRDENFASSVAQNLRINLKDESGEGKPGLRQLTEAALPSGDVALFWRADSVPQTGRVVLVRLYQWTKTTGWKCFGELEILNPLGGVTR